VFERRGRLGVFDHDKIIVLSHEARDAEKFAPPSAKHVSMSPRIVGKRVPRRRRRSPIVAASGVMLVALALLGLSLSPLASGVSIVTGSGERNSLRPVWRSLNG
jgi:hypothetical protein